ncbi:receptor accessory protein 4 [Entomortierella beljakovae]|nr:receptor accessory protein 4 [Entomortierella beljakovae]
MPRGLFRSNKYMPLIRVLLSRGASPTYRSHYPLVRASQRGDTDMVRLLVEYGAPLDITALRWACVEEKDEVIDIFLEKGVKPDGQCLSWCVEKGKTRMVDKLLKLGVVPDLKTYPAYASYKAISSGNNTRLTAWLMYWTVMGIFSLVEFVLDTFVFWFPFYYEIKLLFVLWMILPQTQGSIYLYQAVVDPYLAEHEHDIDKALQDMQKQAMAMGMVYIKRAIQMLQNLALDFYKKSIDQAHSSSIAESQTSGQSSLSAQNATEDPDPSSHSDNSWSRDYFSKAFQALSPKLAAVATMATGANRQLPAIGRPLPVPPVNLYGSRGSSREPSTSGYDENILGICTPASSTSISASDKKELDRLSSRLDKAANASGNGSLRNRKISLYDDDDSPSPQN